MKITKAELIELEACEEGLARFITQTNDTDEPVEVSSLVGGENTYSDLLWLAGEKLPKERIVRFVCDCALLNIELIKPYTNKYDLIVEFLRNPSAVYAANAARDAARAYTAARGAAARGAAARAADSARAAARAAAARAAAWTVDAAWDDAANAVYAANAANAAAAAGNRDKVDELLRGLFA